MKKIAYLTLVVCALITSAYCLLWIASSSSMAFVECGGSSSPFHEIARCRQASYGLIGMVAALAVAFWAIWRVFAIRKRRNVDSNGDAF